MDPNRPPVTDNSHTPINLLLVQNYQNPAELTLSEPTNSFTRHRRAARAVILDQAGGVYLMHAASHGYYKLPGGGLEDGETVEDALHREVVEETGFQVEIIQPLGRTVQFDTTDFRQDSYVYLVRLISDLGQSAQTPEERAAGFQTVYFPSIPRALQAMDTARAALQMDRRAEFDAMFHRDRRLLDLATSIIKP